VAPDDQDTDDVYEGDQQHLGEHRVAQPKCRGNGGIEACQSAFGNQVALKELPYQVCAAPPVPNDQQRSTRKANFHIQQEGY
jgi:hypothetical protein